MKDERQLALPLDLTGPEDPEGPSLDDGAMEPGWVSVTDTRNHVLGAGLLDWLDLYGEEHGFRRDRDLPGYDRRLDFGPFVRQQGILFEQAVVALLKAGQPVLQVPFGPSMERRAAATLLAMRDGAPIVYQGVLRDEARRVQGVPDLLVRSDLLAKLFPASVSGEDVAVPAPGLHAASWHYRVVDIKFRTLHLLVGGGLDNAGTSPAYKVQLHLYNQLLGKTQGYTPPGAYLLGRGWEQQKRRGESCLERLAAVAQDGVLPGGVSIDFGADEAVAWARRIREEGGTWSVVPTPSVHELYPDPKGQNGPWTKAVKHIAEELEELSLMWQVRGSGRRLAHAVGVYRWTDPRLTPDMVGISGAKKPDIFLRVLETNTGAGPAVVPPRVAAARDEWYTPPPLEFFVDFETVSDLADDFALMPRKHGQPLIFMIGCGHLEGASWQFSCFTADSLTEPEEERIIDAWLAHIEATRRRLSAGTGQPRLVHWSHAEESTLVTAFNSARARHSRKDWGDLNWFDFLSRVMREEPVAVRGALGFGLKQVARAMHQAGLITTEWKDGPSDGLGAMVGAWRCHEEAAASGRRLSSLPLMQSIAAYNEVDCRVMMEIVSYLRARH